MRVVMTYDEVKAKAVRRGVCKICGLKMIKQTTFINTVSPFNKNDDGEPCTYAEAQAKVDAKAAAWRTEFVHAACDV
jgi:hypothetical protein